MLRSGHNASSSSKKMMHGLLVLARWNTFEDTDKMCVCVIEGMGEGGGGNYTERHRGKKEGEPKKKKKERKKGRFEFLKKIY